MSPHVLHGFTMADLDDIARLTVLNNRHRLAMWFLNEAIETAWQGAVEFLCQCEERPQKGELIFAAWNAVQKDVRANQKDRVPQMPRSNGESQGIRAAAFWNQATVTQGPEESVTDRTAFRQIWKHLNGSERQVLICNALCDYDLPRTADMLGISKRAVEGRLFRARQRFGALWHEGETPRPMSHKAVRRPRAGFGSVQGENSD